MKYLFIFCLIMLSACANSPVNIVVKNCRLLGSNLYICEEIPQKDIESRR